MLAAEFYDNVYIEQPYPGDVGTYLVYEKIIPAVKDMFPLPALFMGEAAVYHHIGDKVFIRQDDHAVVLVLAAQGIVVIDQVDKKIDFELPGHVFDLPEMEP
jgi:hypothetical protein